MGRINLNILECKLFVRKALLKKGIGINLNILECKFACKTFALIF